MDIREAKVGMKVKHIPRCTLKERRIGKVAVVFPERNTIEMHAEGNITIKDYAENFVRISGKI